MKTSRVIAGFVGLIVLSGCISAERKAEYAAWQNSDDAIGGVTLEVFESQYRQGWHDRAEQKKRERLAREEAARNLASRKAEYGRWLESDDKEDGVTLENFELKYKKGWEARAEQKKQVRLAQETEVRAKEAAERERLAKERAEAEKARIAKEAAEREEKLRLAARTALYEETVADTLAAIKKCYSEGDRYMNPFLGDRRSGRRSGRDENGDWLAKWASPRLGISEADALAGEALLSAFGTKYLPNAYANYEKKRDALAELQQVFNEEFAQPWTIKTTSPKWNSFNKVLEKFVNARTEFFICHDELCHYWLLSRFGVLTDKDFAAIDARRLAVHLLPENVERAGHTLLRPNPMEGRISDFALKYAPESNAIYQKMSREIKELDALLAEVSKQHIQMDDARYSRVLTAAVAKRNDLAREMNTLSLQLQAWYMDHKTTEKSSEDVAKCDAEMSKRLKPFMDALPDYIKEHALGPVIPNSELVAIPDGTISIKKQVEEERGHYSKHGHWKVDGTQLVEKRINCRLEHLRMQRTEVTQLQWMAVMGNNPSNFRGPDRPVESVSWSDCQEFIKRVSQMDGRAYRLPSEQEWEYACRAGSTGDWGKQANGGCGPLETMGWYGNNAGRRAPRLPLAGGRRSRTVPAQGHGTHAVALKESNAWGLFDMHGNVREWCQDQWRSRAGDSYRVSRGGSWYDDSDSRAASERGLNLPDSRSYLLGFRLAVSQN